MLKNDEGEEDKNQAEKQENSIFIPLSLTHERPRTLYKRTDPEWQSFEKFVRDRKRMRSVQCEHIFLPFRGVHPIDRFTVEVANKAKSMIARFPHDLGTPLKIRHYWFDFDFPSGPPPEYEQSGYVS